MHAVWGVAAFVLNFTVACGLSSAAAAQTSAPRMISDAEAPTWTAVGPLNVAGNRSCTATLISDHEAITSAHCLFHPVTHHRAAPKDIRFVLGQRRDTYVALRRVTATAILPGYVYGGPRAEMVQIERDLALLVLDTPVSPAEATPMPVAEWSTGAQVDIVGYGRDRPYMAAIRSGCPSMDLPNWVALIDCVVVPGLSGAPVTLAGQVPRLVAVVSASEGQKVNPVSSLVVAVAPHLAELRAQIGK